MGHKGETILPSCSFDEHMANKFSDFFLKKMTTIRDDIDNHISPISDAVVMSDDIKFEGLPLTKVAPAHKTRYVILSLRLSHDLVN